MRPRLRLKIAPFPRRLKRLAHPTKSHSCRLPVESRQTTRSWPPPQFDGGGPMAVLRRAALTRRRFLSGAAASAGITMAHAIATPISAVRPIGRASPTACSRATSRSIPAWCGRAPTGPRACWSRSRPRDRFRRRPPRGVRRCDAGKRLHRQGDPRRTCRRDRTSSTASASRTIRLRRSSASRWSGASDRAARSRSVSFVWSGDTAGQGWGIDESRGGMRTYATMLRNRPDFFVHSGDSIYADCPIPAELALPNGAMWRNVVTEDKCKVAETLAEYRGNYKYNLLERTCAPSMRKCRPSPNGTTTRWPTTGGRASLCAATAMPSRTC